MNIALQAAIMSLLFSLRDYRCLYAGTADDKSRGRYLFWIAKTVVDHDRAMRNWL